MADGDTADHTNQMVVVIKKCDKTKNLNCESNARIEEFIKLIRIDSWSTYFEIDFNVYDKAPIVQT